MRTIAVVTTSTTSAAGYCAGALLALALIAGCSTRDDLSDYRNASGSDFTAVVAAVQAYYDARNAIATTQDIAAFWRIYPALQRDGDTRSGVNTEAQFAQRTSALGVKTVTTDIAAREPLRVLVKDGRAVAFVHGEEQWVLPRPPNTLFEFTTRVYLSAADGRWTVDKTDERVLGEPYPIPSD